MDMQEINARLEVLERAVGALCVFRNGEHMRFTPAIEVVMPELRAAIEKGLSLSETSVPNAKLFGPTHAEFHAGLFGPTP